MPIYHIYHGKDKVTSVIGDGIDQYSRDSVIWQLKDDRRDKKLAIVPSGYLIIIEEIVREQPVEKDNRNNLKDQGIDDVSFLRKDS